MKIFTSLQSVELQTAIQNGAVGVLPTDTVYGLVCHAQDQSAVARLYDLKSRERKPGTVIAASIGQLAELGVKARYLRAVEQFWPGAVSVVIPCPDLHYVTQGLTSLAVRIPSDPAVQRLLRHTGALLTSSANHPGKPPANNLAEAETYFGDNVDFYVDGGDLSGRAPSTVLRVVDDAIEVLRQGAVIV
jgi:L-threonylcarbamoyladenylate synthase